MKSWFRTRSDGWPRDGWLIPVYVIALVLFGRGAFPLSTSDLFHIQFAAYEWKQGTPERIYTTYEPEVWTAWREEWLRVAVQLSADTFDNPHFYPPFISASLAPLSDVPAYYWRNTLFVANCLLLCLLIELTRVVCGFARTWRAYAWGLPFYLASAPVVGAIRWAQIGLLLAVAIWAAVVALDRRRDRLTGVLLGIPAVIKLSPVVLLAFPASRGRWKPVAVGIGLLASAFLISWLALGYDIHLRWLAATKSMTETVWPNPNEQSLTAAFVRGILGHSMREPFFQQTPAIAMFRLATQLIFGLGTIFAVWLTRSRIARADHPAAIGLLISGMLLSIPFVWIHYFLYLMPVLAWALLKTRDERDRTVWRWVLWAAAFVFFMRFWRISGDDPLGKLATSHFAICNLLFYAWLLRRVWRSRQAALPV